MDKETAMENARRFVRDLARSAPSDSLRKVAECMEGAPDAEIIRFLRTVPDYCTHWYCEEIFGASFIMKELAAAGWPVYQRD